MLHFKLSSGVRVVGYADDIVLQVFGKFVRDVELAASQSITIGGRVDEEAGASRPENGVIVIINNHKLAEEEVNSVGSIPSKRSFGGSLAAREGFQRGVAAFMLRYGDPV